MRNGESGQFPQGIVREHCCAPLDDARGARLMRLYVAVPGSSQSDQMRAR